jgi:hypothetical protein
MAKLPLYTQRMFALMDYAIQKGLKGCLSPYDFLLTIGYKSTGNLTNLKNGSQKFRLDHYQKAGEVYGVDMNFFFKKECTEMGLKKAKPMKSGIDFIKEGVRILELQQQ